MKRMLRLDDITDDALARGLSNPMMLDLADDDRIIHSGSARRLDRVNDETLYRGLESPSLLRLD